MALVLIHLKAGGPATGGRPAAPDDRGGPAAGGDPGPGRAHDAEQALALLRLGVADYLGWPLDLARWPT